MHGENESSMVVESSEIRRIYAVAHLSAQHDTLTVQGIRSIPHQSVSHFSRLSGLRYCTYSFFFSSKKSPSVLVRQCTLAFNSFSAVLWLQCNLAMPWHFVPEVCWILLVWKVVSWHVPLLDVNYRDRLQLKAATDRTLGIGTGRDGGPLLVLSAGTMMKVSINLDNILAYDIQ